MITSTAEQEIDDPDVEYDFLVNPVSGHLEKIASIKRKKDSTKVKIKAQFNLKTTEATLEIEESKNFKAKASDKLEPVAVNDSNSVDELTVLSTELSNMTISFEDYFTTDETKVKADKETDKKSKKAEAIKGIESTNFNGIKVAEMKPKKKDKKDGNKGEKNNESAVVEPGYAAKCSELAAIVQSRGYTRISHTVRSRKHPNKIVGYVLLSDDEVMDDPEEVSLVPVKEVNYLKVKLYVADDLMDDSIEEDATLSEDEGEIKSPSMSEQNDGTHLVKLPKDWRDIFLDPSMKLTVSTRPPKLPKMVKDDTPTVATGVKVNEDKEVTFVEPKKGTTFPKVSNIKKEKVRSSDNISKSTENLLSSCSTKDHLDKVLHYFNNVVKATVEPKGGTNSGLSTSDMPMDVASM